MKRVDTNAKHNCMLKIILNLLPFMFFLCFLFQDIGVQIRTENEMREFFVPVTVF